jgi:prepilin-type N-terminal cleavage/methylation domain-containing protein
LRKAHQQGFTLIELSIVLVIIGLIVGGVLVGQDLIRAAEVRATIAQIEKYNTAVNTFQGKYGALPGDMNAATAAQFGFLSRAGTQGRGDGNGIIEGYWYGGGTVFGMIQAGETLFFWEDLSSAYLIEGSFNSAPDAALPSGLDPSILMPAAKLGRGNYFYIYSNDDVNYYALSGVIYIAQPGNEDTSLALSVSTAYDIDKKMDDGLPTSGNVQANYISPYPNAIIAAPNAGSASSTTCFDTTSNKYSMTQNGGAGVNCALSFQFQ